MFRPTYSITNAIVRGLMDIQHASTVVDLLPLPTPILDLLKKESMEKTVILSTKIEGNTLDEATKRKVLYQSSSDNEEQEVYNLMKALEYLDEAERRQLTVTEEFIKKLHAIIRISHGRRPRVSGYREEQNQVGSRNASGFYLPPEWKDVPVLIEDLVAWVNTPETYSVPVPIKAGIFMWQFLTIHPYLDGNGRTARMITTYLLRRGGYGLKGLFVLENFYDRNLAEYYRRLQLGLHHNYYFGRNEAELTPWLEFFIDGLAEVFQEAAAIVTEKSAQMTKIEPDLIRKLDPQQRMVFAQLTFKQDTLTTSEMRELLRLSDRSIREKVIHWREEGFIEPRDQDAKRVRSVKLSVEYEKLAQEIRNAPEKFAHFEIVIADHRCCCEERSINLRKCVIRENIPEKGCDNEIANHNFYAAYDGFKQMGFEIRYFQDVNDLSDHQKEDVVVGYVDDVRTILQTYDIVAPEMDYPEELAEFLGRKVWKSRLSIIANNPEKWNVFIKPIEDKKFTGIVVKGTKDLVGCGTYGEDPEIFCSDVVKFVTEWRCFVRHGVILDIRRYRGNWRSHFDYRVVEDIVMKFKSAPKGYAVDIGLTDKGETLLIEVNDGYALGHYGLFSLDYVKLLSARWSELTNTTDECDF